jgi:phosphate transport system protein
MVTITRGTFDRQLHSLQDDTLMLGSMVEKAIERSIDALVRLDAELGRQILADDAQINTQRYKLEEAAVQLIATQQPLAGDLRLIASVIHISTDLERMGDYAAGIAKIVLMHGDQPPVKPLIDIPRMAEIACSMLRRSLDAFIRRDVAAARALVGEDDQVDALYDQVYRELLTYMIADPKLIQRATWLLWAAHNVERIADRTTNICERVVYMVTGVNEDVDISTY